MRLLVVDNSNTRTKFAIGNPARLEEWRGVVPTREIDAARLSEVLAGEEFSAAVISSVVPEKRDELLAFLEPLIGKSRIHLVTEESPIGMRIDYPFPAQIGADRLANAAAVSDGGKFPLIVIDFGTAVTFDVISTGPAYCGGAIAPGLGAMTDYLSRKTALLPVIELAKPAGAIGKSTIQAMQSGAFHGYRGLVKEILAALSTELGTAPQVIATGGDAHWISDGMPEIHEVCSDLTLEGIRRIGWRFFSKIDV